MHAQGSPCLLDLTAINLAIDVAEGNKLEFDNILKQMGLPRLSSAQFSSPLRYRRTH